MLDNTFREFPGNALDGSNTLRTHLCIKSGERMKRLGIGLNREVSIHIPQISSDHIYTVPCLFMKCKIDELLSAGI